MSKSKEFEMFLKTWNGEKANEVLTRNQEISRDFKRLPDIIDNLVKVSLTSSTATLSKATHKPKPHHNKQEEKTHLRPKLRRLNQVKRTIRPSFTLSRRHFRNQNFFLSKRYNDITQKS